MPSLKESREIIMEYSSINDQEDWGRKRSLTFFIYNLIYFNCGFEQTLTITTSWVYVTQLIKPKHVYLYYALLNTVCNFPSIFVVSFVANYGDKTRNIKLCLIVIHMISLIGAILYTIPNPNILPVIGALLNGFLLIQRPLMLAEIARSYPKEVLQRKFSFFTGSYGAGSILGPCVAYLFINVDFYMFGLHVTYGNIPGIIRAVQITLTISLIIFFCHDLSKQYDRKHSKQDLSGIKDNISSSMFLKTIKEFDAFYCLLLAFLISLFENLIFVFYPEFINKMLHYENYIVNICYIAPAVVYPILTLVVLKYSNEADVYRGGLFGLLLLATVGCLLVAIRLHAEQWKLFNIIILILLTFLTNILAFFLLMYIAVTLSNLVQSKHQGLVDSIRCQSRMLGGLAGAAIAAYGSEYKDAIGFSCIVTALMLVIMTNWRKKTLSKPKIVL